MILGASEAPRGGLQRPTPAPLATATPRAQQRVLHTACVAEGLLWL